MTNIIELLRPPQVNGPLAGLRAIADQIESGQIDCDRVTLVIGSEVFHLGTDDAHAAQAAVFDLNIGLHKMMLGAHRVLP